jgi:hypothetical protein
MAPAGWQPGDIPNASSADVTLFTPGMITAAADGYTLGLQIQPVTADTGNRYGVPYVEILAGTWDSVLQKFVDQVKGLPNFPTKQHYMQFHSEANIQNGDFARQPNVGTPANFKACFAYVRAYFDARGCSNLIWQVVLTKAVWNSSTNITAWVPDPSVFDLCGVDGYSHPDIGIDNQPTDIAEACRVYARSIGKQAWVDETGSSEDPNNAAYKAAWLAAWPTYLNAHPGDFAGVVFNHAGI